MKRLVALVCVISFVGAGSVGCVEGSIPVGEANSGSDATTDANDAGPSDAQNDGVIDVQDDAPAPSTEYKICIVGGADPTVSCPDLSALEFGIVGDGQDVTRVFRIENQGTTEVTVESIETDTGASEFTIEPYSLTGSAGNLTRSDVTLPKTLVGGEPLYVDVTVVGASSAGPLPADSIEVMVSPNGAAAEAHTVPLEGEFGGCPAGTADCDGEASNGCETDITTVDACGSCSNTCDVSGGTAACNNGACEIAACDAGFDDCDGDPNNGCEADLNSVDTCGACGTTCSFANASAQCQGGSCVMGACDANFDDCDGDTSNGCEADLRSAKTCGTCSRECSNAHGSTRCSGGTCVPSCDASWDDCDGDAANGCETDLSTTSNCGSCGNTCGASGGSATCVAGQCEIAGCGTGFSDCDGDTSNGCETDVTTTTNCGSCGNTCSFPQATEACSSGTCAIDACENGYCDDNGQLGDGCEFDLDTGPTCSAATDLGAISGDTQLNNGAQNQVSASEKGERWFKVSVEEQSSGFCSASQLCVTATVDMPAGVDYDLYMHCDDCTSSDASSLLGVGQNDSTGLRWQEDTLFGCPSGSESGRDVYIRVAHFNANTCASYTLTVQGNVCPSTDTCSSK
jgi:hypothetical protein